MRVFFCIHMYEHSAPVSVCMWRPEVNAGYFSQSFSFTAMCVWACISVYVCMCICMRECVCVYACLHMGLKTAVDIGYHLPDLPEGRGSGETWWLELNHHPGYCNALSLISTKGLLESGFYRCQISGGSGVCLRHCFFLAHVLMTVCLVPSGERWLTQRQQPFQSN